MGNMLRKKTKKLLEKHGIRLSKEQGQPHVVDERVLERMMNYADISGVEKILEIGPGTGNLTEFLISKSKKLVAVERDERLVRVLKERFKGETNLEIIEGDILDIEMPEFDKVVANLPYSISSPVTFKLIEQKFELGVLMYQKEFADRMVAKPNSPEYSRLSVNVSYLCEAEIVEEVPPSSFLPRPEVTSAIVKIRPQKPPFSVRDEDLFFKTVKAIFQHRRKTVRNSLLYSFREIFPELDIEEEEIKVLLDSNLPERFLKARAEELKPEDFGKIANSLGDTLLKAC